MIQQELLGSGRYGDVYKFSYENKQYAGKIFHKNLLPGHPHPSSDQIKKVIRNIEYVSALFDINQHSNIELFHSEVQLTPHSTPILLTELLHENLNSYITRISSSLSVNEQLNLCHDMAKGLQFLHNLDVIHSNLHGANILINKDGQAKIADYICPQIDILNDNTVSHYDVYLSPESITNRKVISKQSDIYSLGVLCLQVSTQSSPVPNNTIEVSETQRWKKQMDQIIKNPLFPLIARCLKVAISRPHVDNFCTKIVSIKAKLQTVVSNTLYQVEVCKYLSASYHTFYIKSVVVV